MTQKEILEKLERMANGDDYNDLDSIISSLRWLLSEAELIKKMSLTDKRLIPYYQKYDKRRI